MDTILYINYYILLEGYCLNKRIFFSILILFLVFSVLGTVNATVSDDGAVQIADVMYDDSITVSDDPKVEALDDASEDNLLSGIDNDDNLRANGYSDSSVLENIIYNTSSEGIIELTTDYNFSSQIKINKNLTIDGKGHILDGNNQKGIFNITPGVNVQLYNLKIVNGYSSQNGGAFFNNGILTILNCSFVNNSVNNTYCYGGAIYNYGGYLNIYNSSFVNNSANGTDSYGGAIYNYGGYLNIYNSSFVNNYANDTNSYGGAIYGGDNLSVSNSIFVNNYANGTNSHGGAIFCGGNTIKADINIIDCNFINNSVYNGGGGAINYLMSYDYSTGNLTVRNCSFEKNSASGFGGAVSANGNFIVYNSHFLNNSASGNGGAITGRGNFTVYNSSFVNNSASNGGAFNNPNNSSLFVHNCIFNNNSATIHDSVIYNNGSLIIQNCTFDSENPIYNYWNENSFKEMNFIIQNAVSNSTIELTRDYQFDANFDDDFFNGIIISKNLTIDGKGHTIDGKNCARIFNISKRTNIKLYNLNIINGNSTANGAIYGDGALTVTNCSFVNNKEGSILSNGALNVTNCIFENNNIPILSHDVLTVTNCSFLNNSATGSYECIIYSISALTVTNCSFLNNSAFYSAISSKNITVSNCSFVNNTASKIISSRDVIVFNCSFLNNEGCAIYGSGNISNCSFVNNNNNLGNGGAINGNGTFYNCNFTNTRASTQGGAIYGNGNFSNCSFINNGGAIYGNGNFSNCSFINNTAKSNGGAIYGSGNFSNCSFINNTANFSGGAIYGSGNFSNCGFMNNTANGNGSAIYARDNSTVVSYCSFLNNKGNYVIYAPTRRIKLRFNWWGTNNPINISNIGPSDYIIMTTTINLTNFEGNKEITIEVDFNHIHTSDGVYELPFDSPFRYVSEVYFSTNNGTLSNTVQKLEDGKASVKYSTIYGINTVTVYSFNETQNITFEIKKYSTAINTSNCEVDYGQNALINFSLNHIVNDHATLIVMNKSNVILNETVLLSEYDFTYNLEDMSAGTYEVILQFGGNDDFEASSATSTVTINKINPEIVIGLTKTIGHGDLFIANATIVPELSGDVIFEVRSGDNVHEEIVSLTDSIAKFSLDNLNTGNYTFIATYIGDDNYNRIAAYEYFEVLPQVVVKHTGNDTKDLQDAIDLANPYEVILLGNYSYEVGLININKSISIVGDTNTEITSTCGENTIFNVSSSCRDITIRGVRFKAAYNNTEFVKVACEEDDEGISHIPQITITGNEFATAEGVNPESVTALKVQTDSTNFNPDNDINLSGNIGGAEIITCNVGEVDSQTGDVIITYTKIQTFFHIDNASIYDGVMIVILKGANEVKLTGETVNYSINGQNMSDVIDENGQIRIIGLIGNVKIEFSFDGNEKYNSSIFSSVFDFYKDTKFTFNNPIINAYPNFGYLSVTLKDVAGKSLSGKNITFTFNGKQYFVTTDANGQISFKVSVGKASSYVITGKFVGDSQYAGSSFSKTIKVTKNNVKFASPTKKIKKSQAKKAKFKITLKTSNGKKLAGKKISIKINKKTITAKTNTKGIATFKLKLPKTKKTYKYKVTFKGDAGNNKKNYSGKLKIY